MQEKFAFESGRISIAFSFYRGLGDAVVSRKVFNAIVELAPDCLIDIFYFEDSNFDWHLIALKNLKELLKFFHYFQFATYRICIFHLIILF